jgi:hypothetical protein
LQCLFRFFDFAAKRQELCLPAPNFRVAGVFADDVRHCPQGNLVLSGVILLESPFNFGVNRLTAPLEFLAASARTGRVRVGAHGKKSLIVEGSGYHNSGYGLRAAGKILPLRV